MKIPWLPIITALAVSPVLGGRGTASPPDCTSTFQDCPSSCIILHLTNDKEACYTSETACCTGTCRKYKCVPDTGPCPDGSIKVEFLLQNVINSSSCPGDSRIDCTAYSCTTPPSAASN
jgi:hypothetical protein